MRIHHHRVHPLFPKTLEIHSLPAHRKKDDFSLCLQSHYFFSCDLQKHSTVSPVHDWGFVNCHRAIIGSEFNGNAELIFKSA